MVTDEGLSKSGSLSYNGNHGEIVAPKKKVVEEPRRALRRLVETMTLGVPAVMVALLPFIMTYVPAPESVLRLKDFVAEWCTPSLCFVFLIVGVMVATSGVLNGTHAGGMHDRADVYQRHVTVVQRDSLRMPDIFSAGESVRPLSIPAPVPVPFAVPVPVRDFPPASPRALPIYLKREALPGHDHELRSPLGKSRSSPLPVVKENIPSAKLPSYQSLTQEASYLSTAREPVVVDTLQERPTARKPSPAAAPVPVFEHEVPMVSAPVVVPSPAYTPVIEEVPTAPVLDREIPAVAPPSPIPSPVFVHEDITVPDTVPTPTPIDDPVSDREMSPDPTPPPPPPPAAPVFDSEIPTAPMPAEVKVSASVARRRERGREGSGRRPPSHPSSQRPGDLTAAVAKTSSSQVQKGESALIESGQGSGQTRLSTSVPGSVVASTPAETKEIVPQSQKHEAITNHDDDVDLRTEAFLANFRQQMRLQRQESLLRQQRGEEQ